MRKRILILCAFLVVVLVAAVRVGMAYSGQETEVTVGVEGKEAGDVIAMRHDWQIIKWCNFDKQIVVTSRYVLCIYRG